MDGRDAGSPTKKKEEGERANGGIPKRKRLKRERRKKRTKY